MNQSSPQSILTRFLLRRPSVRLAGAACLISLLACAGAGLVLYPLVAHHDSVERSIAEARDTLVSLQLPGPITEAFARATDELDRVDERLEQPVQQATLSEQLSRLAAVAAVTIDSQSYKEMPAQTGIGSLHLDTTLIGSYEGVRTFLNSIEQLPTLTLIRAIDIEKSGQDANTVKAVLQLETYRRLSENVQGERR